VRLLRTIPSLPAFDVAAAVDFYRERLGFVARHQDDGFAVLVRDDAEMHLWQSDDESWRDRGPQVPPVRSGAESFLAGTASARIEVEGVDDLYDELSRADVLHRVSADGVSNTDFGTREFAVVDLDGNQLSFFSWLAG
jgi:catechol 2,3-dioxygenase-like lactoylglutathione lyase family enzyme